MTDRFPIKTDDWLLEKGPNPEVVISSRARLARNLAGHRFAPHSKDEILGETVEELSRALESSPYFKDFDRFDIAQMQPSDRGFLRESHLISSELEKGRPFREVYLNSDATVSIMINEEDHLRIQTMTPGFQVRKVYEKAEEVGEELEKVLELAYSPQFGFLTACPTNTGTGLRVSVMLHLVGLVVTSQIEEALSSLNNFGLVVRGAYGEHSAHVGDIFQVSNEITLGKTEDELIEILNQVTEQIIEREKTAREMFLKHAAVKFEDTVHRAIGILRHARTMESKEAVTLLSRIRLGLDRDLGIPVSHEELNRLIIEVQPAHLRRLTSTEGSVEGGDAARATLLRNRFRNGSSGNSNN